MTEQDRAAIVAAIDFLDDERKRRKDGGFADDAEYVSAPEIAANGLHGVLNRATYDRVSVTGPDRLQAAREALERARSFAASALQRTAVGSMAEAKIEETQSAIGEALALLQGPDTLRDAYNDALSAANEAGYVVSPAQTIRDMKRRLQLTELIRPALSGPDTSRKSSETAARIVSEFIRGKSPLNTHAEMVDAIAVALDAVAEGQGDLLKAVALVVKNFRQDDKDGRRSRDRRYVLDMLERFVPEHLPVSASKPEGA